MLAGGSARWCRRARFRQRRGPAFSPNRDKCERARLGDERIFSALSSLVRQVLQQCGS